MQYGNRLACRSAAMLGLAVTMGATSCLFAPRATAVGSTSLSPLTTLIDQAAELPPNADQEEQLAAPSVKYRVKEGESLWQIAQTFQVAPEAIAAVNQIPSEAILTAGQSLKIPTQSVSVALVPPPAVTALPTVIDPVTDPTAINANTPAINLPQGIDASVSSLRPTSSPALMTAKTVVVKPSAQAEIADVSRPIQVIPAAEQATSTNLENAAKGVGLPVSPPRLSLPPTQVTAAAPSNEPIAIVVTPPDELRPSEQVEVSHKPEPFIVPQSSPLPAIPDVAVVPHKPRKNNEGTVSGESASLDSLRRNGLTVPEPPVEMALNTPISIPVTPPAVTAPTAPTATSLPDFPPETPSTVPEIAAPMELTAAIQEPSQLTPAAETYKVQSGDTLSQIARSYKIDPVALEQANGLNNPNQLQVDQVLRIPQSQTIATAPSILTLPVSQRTVNTAETINSEPESRFQEQLKADVTQLNHSQPIIPPQPPVVASTTTSLDQAPDWQDRTPSSSGFNQPRQDLAELQRQYLPRTQFAVSPPQLIGAAPSSAQDYNPSFQIPVGQEVSPELPPLNTPDFPKGPKQFNGYSWPAKGVLTSGYGPRWGRMHRGIDIAGPIGTPIMAAASGEVISAGWNSGGFGKLVKIRHADGSITYYAHNNRILVRRGEYVKQGQQVAEMGSTGRSTGPHLHFEIRPDGKSAINPIALLPRK